MAAGRTDEFARERSRGRGAEYWRDVLARWGRSGLTQAEYCRRRGLSIGTFRWWRHALARRNGGHSQARVVRGRTRGSPEARFVAVRVRGADDGMPSTRQIIGSDSRIDLVLNGGRVLRIGRGFDREALLEIVRVLESGAC